MNQSKVSQEPTVLIVNKKDLKVTRLLAAKVGIFMLGRQYSDYIVIATTGKDTIVEFNSANIEKIQEQVNNVIKGKNNV